MLGCDTHLPREPPSPGRDSVSNIATRLKRKPGKACYFFFTTRTRVSSSHPNGVTTCTSANSALYLRN